MALKTIAVATSEASIQIPAKYRQKTTRGNRVPGWEDLDIGKLARKLKLTSKWACDVLSGRRAGSMTVLESIARELKSRASEVVARIERAQIATGGRRRIRVRYPARSNRRRS